MKIPTGRTFTIFSETKKRIKLWIKQNYAKQNWKLVDILFFIFPNVLIFIQYNNLHLTQLKLKWSKQHESRLFRIFSLHEIESHANKFDKVALLA